MKSNIYAQLHEVTKGEQGANIVTTFLGEKGSMRNKLVKRLLLDQEADEFMTEPFVDKDGDRTSFYEPVSSKDRMIIFGGGHIALSLCEFAAKAGFKVTVVDDRPEFANHVRFPWAEDVICESFERVFEKRSIRDNDYVTIITRGHRYDADCLRSIFKNPLPFYLGMIGSRRRVQGLFHMLEEEGYSREKMEKICTPIGLDIGAVLPEEIAISILAEMILYKRKKNSQSVKNIISSDLDSDVITYLESLEEPSAVVTVMDAKGSTPRGAGAKMVVNCYGKTYGSIGGGCAEKDIINAAIGIISTGTYQVVKVDLTGEVAESEGMVCGGIMNVLIEDYSEG